MKKIIFKASEGKAENLVNLMKEANKISCRIQIDFVEKIVLVYDIEDADVPNLLDLVMSSYEIAWVYMDNLENSNEVTEDANIMGNSQNSTEPKVESQTGTEETTKAEPTETEKISKVEPTVESKTSSKKANTTQTITIEKAIAEALDKLDSTKNPEEQIETFLEDIGMPKTEKLKYAFTVALDMPRITFEAVTAKISEKYPKWKEADIKKELRKVFKNWIEKNPELVENYSRSSLVSIIKLFVKKVK